MNAEFEELKEVGTERREIADWRDNIDLGGINIDMMPDDEDLEERNLDSNYYDI